MTFEKGIEEYKAGKFEEALVIFNQLIDQKEGEAEYHLFRGRVLSRLGKTQEALADFDIITTMEPYNTDWMSDRAVVLHLLKRNEEALAEFDRAVNLDPKNPYRYSSRAFFKERIGDLEGSIADYTLAIELDPEDAISYNNRGIVEDKLGYQQQAKRSFKKADDLVGYDPEKLSKKREADDPKPEIPKSTASQLKNANSNSEQKSGMTHYVQVFKSLLTDPKTRSEFSAFLKKMFKSSK
ncbi:tetratricopeptide repeat protein [Algoriphagus namhaensis]|uniref:Tetratricopeptide repeat protein n=1 Tax=Algoriphagus namhaensis TaxID=915353 RepID=A0ABV8AU23_9BACT